MSNVSNRRSGHRFGRVLWGGALVLALAPFQVNAADWSKPTGWVLKPGADGRYQVLPGSGGSVPTTYGCNSGSCTGSGSLKLPGLKPETRVNPSVPFNKAGIARGAAGLAGRLFWPVAVGTALYDWYKAANVEPNADGWTAETGAQSSVSTVYCRNGECNTLTRLFSSVSAYANDATTKAQLKWALCGNEACTEERTDIVQTAADTWQVKFYAVGKSDFSANYVYRVTKTTCVYTDTGAGSGINPTGGLCPGGSYQPVTEDVARTKLENASIPDQTLARAIPEIFDRGGQIADLAPSSVTGPSSVPGPTSSTTRTEANGTQSVSTTTTNYNITYNGDTITINETKTTTNADGSTTVESKPQDPPPDTCADNPNVAGCVELGDPGTAQLPTVDKPISFTPVSFTDSGSCPAPITFTAMGRSYSFSYASMCDTIGAWVRALVLAIGAFVASWVFVQGLKA